MHDRRLYRLMMIVGRRSRSTLPSRCDNYWEEDAISPYNLHPVELINYTKKESSDMTWWWRTKAEHRDRVAFNSWPPLPLKRNSTTWWVHYSWTSCSRSLWNPPHYLSDSPSRPVVSVVVMALIGLTSQAFRVIYSQRVRVVWFVECSKNVLPIFVIVRIRHPVRRRHRHPWSARQLTHFSIKPNQLSSSPLSLVSHIHLV